MKHLHAFVAAGGLIAVAACTTKDSLLDEVGSSGGAATAGSVSAQAGSAQSSGGAASKGGASPKGGASSKGGSSTGSSGTAGSADTSGGAAGVPVDPPECPDGQMWCPGCSVGSGLCAVVCPVTACEPCSDVTTQAACDARIGCHSVFQAGSMCKCPTVACCMEFRTCADADKVDCEGKSVMCDALTPACANPAFVNSYTPTCYEGCVDPKDCAAPVCPAVPADGCSCAADADCSSGRRCYAADCANKTLGTCRQPPSAGCFGDADCPSGQTCMGGLPARCGSTMQDTSGTCGVEACPEGDCPGGSGPTCSCSEGDQCMAATGPLGNAHCRGADGVCWTCKCASPDTPIATPHGERKIAELRTGDLVYSVDGDGIRAVPIVRVNRTPVVGHHVLHVTFENGRFIEMTAEHPLADGRPLSALSAGSKLIGSAVVGVTRVAYTHDATYDILPDSTSGAYFASGVLIGSTLAGFSRQARGSCQATAQATAR